MSKEITLQLQLNVTYDLNGTHPSTLSQRLLEVADRASGEGLLTGPLDAEVVTWDAKVVTPNSEHSDSGWRPAAEAPRDGRTLLFSLKDGSETMFGRWIHNPWTGDERFTSVNPTDPEAMDWSIPDANLPNWLYFEITPPWEAVK